MEDDKLWRVWIEGRWRLVCAPDTDHVYRSFRKATREKISRVDLVRKTSEVLAKEN